MSIRRPSHLRLRFVEEGGLTTGVVVVVARIGVPVCKSALDCFVASGVVRARSQPIPERENEVRERRVGTPDVKNDLRCVGICRSLQQDFRVLSEISRRVRVPRNIEVHSGRVRESPALLLEPFRTREEPARRRAAARPEECSSAPASRAPAWRPAPEPRWSRCDHTRTIRSMSAIEVRVRCDRATAARSRANGCRSRRVQERAPSDRRSRSTCPQTRARGHVPNEQAASKCLYLVTRSLDPRAAQGHAG